MMVLAMLYLASDQAQSIIEKIKIWLVNVILYLISFSCGMLRVDLITESRITINKTEIFSKLDVKSESFPSI